MREQLSCSLAPVPVYKLISVTTFFQHSMPWTTLCLFSETPRFLFLLVFTSLGVEDKPLPKPGGFTKSATVLKEEVVSL